MGEDGKWCGGTSVLVQVGDILDRGDNELAIMRKFRARQGSQGGGRRRHRHQRQPRDHERARRFPIRHQGAYGECARYAANKREKEIAKVGEENVEPLPEVPGGVNPETCMGVLARRDLFLPGGEMAVRLASNPTVLQVGDTVFAHAGIDKSTVEYGSELTTRLRRG